MRKGKTLVADLPRIVILVDKNVKKKFKKRCLEFDKTQQEVGIFLVNYFLKNKIK